MIVEGLYKRLINDAGLLTLLGATRGDGTTGIFPVIAPKEVTLPYIVYEQLSNDNSLMTAEGLNRTQSGRWRFHCYAGSYSASRLVAQAVKKSLAAFMGTLTDADATPVWDITPVFEADGPVDSETRATIYNHIIDFEVWYSDTTN